MSRVCIVALFLCAVFATGYVHGNLIRSKDVMQDGVKKEEPQQNAVVEDGAEEVPEAVAPKCKEIGEFCMNHSDCCSISCLGYLKRCVS